MNVLLLNTQMEAAGAQKALLTLARGLKEAGHQVTVVTMYDKGNYIPMFNKQYGLDIIDLQMKLVHTGSIWRNGKAVVQGLSQLFQLMRQKRFDVVQTFSHYSNILGPLLAALAGIPVRVVSQRMSLMGSPRWVIVAGRWITNSPLVHMMTAVSEGTRHFSIQTQGIRPDKLITVYNGIDVAQYDRPLSSTEMQQLRQALGLTDTAVIILTVARLHPQKGHHYLLKAVPAIRKAIPNAHFLFVGEGELEGALREQIEADSTLTNCVHLLGMRQDIPHLLAIGYLFVLPSLWEGMPNVLLEAMAAGLPVVSTDVDGCPEVVVNDETGFLVPAQNTALLQEAIVHILQNDSLATAMSKAARQRARNHFSIEQNIASYQSLYERLLSRS